MGCLIIFLVGKKIVHERGLIVDFAMSNDLQLKGIEI
jgi:hypothetical protein